MLSDHQLFLKRRIVLLEKCLKEFQKLFLSPQRLPLFPSILMQEASSSQATWVTVSATEQSVCSLATGQETQPLAPTPLRSPSQRPPLEGTGVPDLVLKLDGCAVGRAGALPIYLVFLANARTLSTNQHTPVPPLAPRLVLGSPLLALPLAKSWCYCSPTPGAGRNRWPLLYLLLLPPCRSPHSHYNTG